MCHLPFGSTLICFNDRLDSIADRLRGYELTAHLPVGKFFAGFFGVFDRSAMVGFQKADVCLFAFFVVGVIKG